MKKQDVLDSLWVEKYRPIDLSEMALTPLHREKLEEYLAVGNIPHVLFEGPPGSGKTTAARIIIEKLPCSPLLMNASDERGIEVVRKKIKNFARMATDENMKIIFLDEMDNITPDAQKALKTTIEKYAKSTRFIMACNHVNKVDDAILSRCQIFHFTSLPKPEMLHILRRILKVEKIKYEMDDLQKHVDLFYPDLRRAINEMQLNIRSEKFVYIDNSDLYSRVISLILDKKLKDIRKLLVENAVDYPSLYRFIYDNIEQFPKKLRLQVLLDTAEYLWRDATVIDKEMNFAGFCAKLIPLV